MKGDTHMLAKLRNITKNDEGASAVEYGLLVAAVAAVIVVIVFAFGNVIQEVFQGTCETVADGTAGAPVAVEAGCGPAAP